MPSGRFLFGGLTLVLAIAPLPFGSVGVEASAALASACLAMGVPWVLWRLQRGLPALPWREPVLIWGALFALLGAAQIVPLPRAVLQSISPRAVELRDQYEPPPPSAEGFPCEGRAPVGWRPLSLYPWATRQSVLRFAACLVAVLITIDLAVQQSASKKLATALAACGAFQAIYGLGEFATGRQHIFGYARRYYTDVATGTFINRNHFAGYLEMTLPLALALAVIAFPRGRTGTNLGRRVGEAAGRETFVSGIFLLAALTMVTALLCSRSRMGIASALLALGCVALVAAWRGQGRGLAVAVLLAGGGAVLLFGQGEGAEGFERFRLAGDEITAGRGRWSIWSQAGGVAAAFPWFGAGLGTFEHVFPAFRTAGEGISLAHAHNDFLELAAETGVAGCAVFALGVALVAAPVLRRRDARTAHDHLGRAVVAGVLAIALHSVVDFNLAIPANALTFSVLVGMALAWRGGPAPVLAVDRDRRDRRSARAWAPAAALAALAALALIPAVAGPAENPGGGRASATETDPPPLARRSAAALAWLSDSDNAERLHAAAAEIARAEVGNLQVLFDASARGDAPSAGAARYVRGRLMAAGAVQAQALRLQPTSARGHLMMGHLCAGLCTADALAGAGGADCLGPPLEEFGAALRLAPVSASVHAQVARFYLRAWPALDEGRRREAIPHIERAIAMNRRAGDLAAAWSRARSAPAVARE